MRERRGRELPEPLTTSRINHSSSTHTFRCPSCRYPGRSQRERDTGRHHLEKRLQLLKEVVHKANEKRNRKQKNARLLASGLKFVERDMPSSRTVLALLLDWCRSLHELRPPSLWRPWSPREKKHPDASRGQPDCAHNSVATVRRQL